MALVISSTPGWVYGGADEQPARRRHARRLLRRGMAGLLGDAEGSFPLSFVGRGLPRHGDGPKVVDRDPAHQFHSVAYDALGEHPVTACRVGATRLAVENLDEDLDIDIVAYRRQAARGHLPRAAVAMATPEEMDGIAFEVDCPRRNDIDIGLVEDAR